MPPTLILIRHAQALHNVNHDIHDPPLTELGLSQCAELQKALTTGLAHDDELSAVVDKAELIVASPMRRTLQTARFSLGWLIERNVKVLASADWQENSSKPCDTGSSVVTMQSEFPGVDFSTLDPLYPDKTTNGPSNPYAYTEAAILARGQRALADLKARPEKVIAVVTHSAFLRTAVSNTRYFNADFRVFEFAESGPGADGSGRCPLREWKVTEERGGGMGLSEKGHHGIWEGEFAS